MGRNKSITNIISLRDHGPNGVDGKELAAQGEDANVFIVDMLDRLMQIAAKEDQSVLVYLLAMARAEAIESSKAPE